MRITLMLAVVPWFMATSLPAQGLRQKIREVFTFPGACGEPLCLSVAPGTHGAHFIPSAVAGNDVILNFVADAIGQAVANVPVSSASGGATFTFSGGVPVRTTVSEGPIFGERAQTLGRRRFHATANVSYSRFTALRGTRLSDIELNFTHQNVGSPLMGDPAFENDIIELRADLELDLLVASFVANYGLLDGVDVSVAVPLVRTSLRATSAAQVVPFGEPFLHQFGTTATPSLLASAATTGSAIGVGDVALRAKAVVQRAPALALLAEVRVPTGDEDDLLGTGELAVRGLGIYSARHGAFSPHFNFGYLYRAGETQNDALLATLGFDHLMSPRATLAFDVISEWQIGDAKIAFPEDIVIQVPSTRVVRSTNVPDRRDDIVGASLGAKLLAGNNVHVVANTLIPLNRGGLRPNAVWTFGLEYDF